MAEQTEAKTEAAPKQQENKKLPSGAAPPPGDVRNDPPRRVQRKGPFIKYVGPVAHREIDATAWNSLHIDVKKDDDGNVIPHTWNVYNDKMVEANKFTDAQLDYLLIDDVQVGSGVHNFLAFDYNENGQLDQVELS